MTDNDDQDKRGRGSRPPRSGGDAPRSFKPRGERADGGRRPEGGRPPRREGDGGNVRPRTDGERKPFRPREDGDRPRAFKPRAEGDRDAPRGDRPPRRDFGDKPRSDRDGERPFKPKGDRPPRREGDGGNFRPRPDGERKPFRPREDGDRPRAFKPRAEGDRPPRRDFGDRPRGDRDGERKPFRSREGGDRPAPRSFKPRGDARPANRETREDRIEAKADDTNRIAKVIARAGLCSRRDAEAWIEAGRVSVNGVVIESPALDVTPGDAILVDGAPLPERERTRLWLYHKPKGLETTEHSPEGRPTVFDNLPAGLPRVVSVGRLDINTEGLLLLTNDGGLARVLSHPNTAWLRRYRVRVFGPVDQAQLDTLRDGITIEDPEDGPITYAPIVARLERSRGDNSWLTMDLREGKNREIKRVLEHFGLQVTRLIRISFGPFQLGDMPEGTAEEIRGRYLRDQLGERLMQEAGVDFDAPIYDHAADEADEEPRRERGPRRDFDRRDPVRRDRPESGARPVKRDRFEAEDERPQRGSPQDREGHSKTAWSAEPLPERRRDSKKPGEKRNAALLGTRDDLKVTKERVADRKGREVKVERVKREVPDDVADAPDWSVRDPNRRFGKKRDERGEGRSFGDRPKRTFSDGPARGGKPFRPREDGERTRSFKPRGEGFGGDRPPRRDGAEGERPRTFKPRGDKPFRPREDGDRPRSFKPRGEGFGGDRPQRREGAEGDRPRTFKPRGDAPFRPREDGDRPRSFKPRGEGFGGKPGGFKGGKPDGRPGGGKPGGGKPGGGRPGGGKPGGGRPGGGRPGGGFGGRPGGSRPGGRPRD